MINLALVGREIAHSRSPEIYQKLLKKVSYKLLDYQERNSIPDLKNLFEKYDLLGLNITSPYKSHFFDQVNVANTSFKKLGLINCIKKVDKGFLATNTDFLAVREILDRFIEEGYKHFVLLGNGAMAKITLNILDKLCLDFNISYLQYFRKKNGPIDELDFKNESINGKMLIINSCSRNFVFRGTLPKNSYFWDYNYSHIPHQRQFKNYIDGYELLLLQGIYALKFLGIYT